MRLIDADSIQEELAALILYSAGTPEGECIEYAHNLIDAQPTIDATPMVHAHWIQDKGLFRNHIVKCSHCGNFLDMNGVNAGRGNANFCPNCGADMRGENDDEIHRSY